MKKLDNFINMMTGHFNNKEQFHNMQKEGKTPIEAIIEAARMRLRPILMTSLAFILGVLPLVISHGAGSGAQNAVGTGVMGGMFAATVLAIYFVPVFFVVMEHLFARFKKA